MTSIHIETSWPDYSFNRAQYDTLVADLESQGAAISVETAPEIRKGGLPTVFEISVYVRDLAEAGVTAGAVAAAIRKHLRGRRMGATRTVTIYGPGGREVLSTFELEEAELPPQIRGRASTDRQGSMLRDVVQKASRRFRR